MQKYTNASQMAFLLQSKRYKDMSLSITMILIIIILGGMLLERITTVTKFALILERFIGVYIVYERICPTPFH